MAEKEATGFDWDKAVPGPEAWEALQTATDDSFPHTYGGEAWHAAWRLLRVAREHPERFASWDGWTSDELADEAVQDLDLTGFMFGYALNALRFMMELPPVADGATVVIGAGDRNATVRSMPASPEGELHKAIGGTPAQDLAP